MRLGVEAPTQPNVLNKDLSLPVPSILRLINFASFGSTEYLDVILDRAVSFHEQPILWGVGKLGYKNNSEYVTVNKHKRFKLKDLQMLKFILCLHVAPLFLRRVYLKFILKLKLIYKHIFI